MREKLTWEKAPATLTVAQAAELVGVHANSVRNWIHGGDLPARRTSSGHFRIDKQALATFWRETPRFAGPIDGRPTREKAADIGILACRIIGALDAGDSDKAKQAAWDIYDLARIIKSETTPL